MTRRQIISALTASQLLAQGRRRRLRLAVCNETFEGTSFEECCRLAVATGYTGLEIMPATLSPDPATLPPSRRAELRSVMHDSGLTFIGMHAALSAPAGLHLTTPDAAVRQRGWDYFRRMIDLTADLGPASFLVLGSAKQRAAAKGESPVDALARLRDGLAESAPHAKERGVLLLPETLAPHLCNVLTSLGQAVEMVRSIGHPSVQTMFDTHNALEEIAPHDVLIRRHAPLLRHIHVNEMDGRHPGTGNYDFGLLLRTLQQIRYGGWVSLEVFQFKPSGEQIARESAELLRRLELSAHK